MFRGWREVRTSKAGENPECVREWGLSSEHLHPAKNVDLLIDGQELGNDHGVKQHGLRVTFV